VLQPALADELPGGALAQRPRREAVALLVGDLPCEAIVRGAARPGPVMADGLEHGRVRPDRVELGLVAGLHRPDQESLGREREVDQVAASVSRRPDSRSRGE
jgi:hypothetical protein